MTVNCAEHLQQVVRRDAVGIESIQVGGIRRDATAESLESSLTAIARLALARAKDSDIVRLTRMVIAEAARVPDLAYRTYTTTWFARIDAVIALLSRHVESGKIRIDNIEIAAEQFLAMVGAFPAWLAAFGHSRSPEFEERYIQQAVESFVRSVRIPMQTSRRPSRAVKAR